MSGAISVFHDPVLDEDVANQVELFGVGTAKNMSTEERMAIVPSSGQFIWDVTENKLYIGDGSTRGGVVASANLPNTISLGDWTDELEDVYDMGDWTR